MKEIRQYTAVAALFASRLFSLRWAYTEEKRSRWNPLRAITCGVIRLITNITCRIERVNLAEVPQQGPLILVFNHIGSIEVPLLYAHLYPRPLFGLAKVETWDNRFMAWLFDLFQAIPIRRGEADMEAIRRSLAVLDDGDILAIAPEGTRSRHGRLLRGQPGIATLALRSGASILPVVHWGGEQFNQNLKRLKRTDFHIRVGKPFRLDACGEKVGGEARQAMADEIMYQLAVLMPEAYRGEYAAAAPPPQKYLRFV